MTRRIFHHTSPAKPPHPRAGEKRQGPAPEPPPSWRNWLIYIGLAATLLLFFLPIGRPSVNQLSYTQFLDKVNVGQVKTATIDPDGAVSGTLSNSTHYSSQIPVALQDNSLPGLLKKHHVQITAEGPPSTTFLTIVLNLLPFILLVGVFWYLGRRARAQMGAGLGGIPGLGVLTGSRAKLYDEDRPSSTFA